ncbi:hypothetical protein [Streptomyces sp. SPB162]|uniref:hypothetical protein n=1 Tax=Streptomyces sp. SPB162 TaxID=2940560 RepID=UPI0024050164|nr:hypothetical protein [Streptomyces sp. SPB162]MDF9810935.1 hypothetical protein [Streptomyces sp. SPB162]
MEDDGQDHDAGQGGEGDHDDDTQRDGAYDVEVHQEEAGHGQDDDQPGEEHGSPAGPQGRRQRGGAIATGGQLIDVAGDDEE